MAKLKKAEAKFVDWQRVARLATADAAGVPHNIPICPLLDDGKIYLATEDGRKVRNMRANPNVCVVFDQYTEVWDDLKQVMVTGTASIVKTGTRWRALRKRFYEKFEQYPTMGGGIGEGDTLIAEIKPIRVFSSGL